MPDFYLVPLIYSNRIERSHNFFQIPDESQEQLIPLALIHSVQEQKLEVVNNGKPYLEIVAGSWKYNEFVTIPQVLLENLMKLI